MRFSAMRKGDGFMQRLAALLFALLLAPAVASADTGWSPRKNYKELGTLLTATNVGNGSLTTITFSPKRPTDPTGFQLIIFAVTLAQGDATTDVTLNCTGSVDGGTTDVTIDTCSTSSGVCTSYASSFLKDNVSSGAWGWRFDITGYRHVECTFAVANSGVATNDLVIQGALSDG
jgi:hypothetical protein